MTQFIILINQVANFIHALMVEIHEELNVGLLGEFWKSLFENIHDFLNYIYQVM